jgi:hypothetical protein
MNFQPAAGLSAEADGYLQAVQTNKKPQKSIYYTQMTLQYLNTANGKQVAHTFDNHVKKP